MTNQGDLYLFRLNEGDIMPDPRVAIIFSGRGWLNDYAGVYAIVDFVQSLSNSPYWMINTEYTGNGRRVGATVRLEGWTIDADSPYAYVSSKQHAKHGRPLSGGLHGRSCAQLISQVTSLPSTLAARRWTTTRTTSSGATLRWVGCASTAPAATGWCS